MLLQPITVPFSKSTLKPSVYTLRGNVGSLDAPGASQLFTFGHRRQGIALRGS